MQNFDTFDVFQWPYALAHNAFQVVEQLGAQATGARVFGEQVFRLVDLALPQGIDFVALGSGRGGNFFSLCGALRGDQFGLCSAFCVDQLCQFAAFGHFALAGSLGLFFGRNCLGACLLSSDQCGRAFFGFLSNHDGFLDFCHFRQGRALGGELAQFAGLHQPRFVQPALGKDARLLYFFTRLNFSLFKGLALGQFQRLQIALASDADFV